MMVSEDQTATIKKPSRPSTTPLASMAGAFARTSSVMAIPPPELPVAPPLEDDDAPRAARGAAAQETGDAGFEPAAQRAERPVEREHHPHQDEQLAGAEHRPASYPAPRRAPPRGAGRPLRPAQVRRRLARPGTG